MLKMEGLFIFTYVNSRFVIVEKVGVAERARSHFFCNKESNRNVFNSRSTVDLEGNKTPGKRILNF